MTAPTATGSFRIGRRRAFTLLELVAALCLLGIFLAVVAVRGGRSGLTAMGAQAEARRLAIDLAQARRRAIADGSNHVLKLSGSSGNYSGYTLYRRGGAGADTAVDEFRPFTAGVAVSSGQNELEFNFEGQALAAYSITLSGGERSWQVAVTPVTGHVKVHPAP